MINAKPRVWIDMILSWIGSIIGMICFSAFSLLTIVGLYEVASAEPGHLDNEVAFPVLTIFGVLAILNFFLIRKSKRTRRLIRDFRYYSSILAQDKSVDALVRAVYEPEDEVLSKLMKMCRRGYFQGDIDMTTNMLVFNKPLSGYVARCPGCGATTKIYKTGDICRYCGNPLEAKPEVRETIDNLVEEMTREIKDTAL